MLIVLFAIKIVANNFFGRSRSSTTIFPLAVFLSPISLISVDESPKSATSAPEIRADKISSITRIAVFRVIELSKTTKLRSILNGSVSNS